jgi:hypothetical protein
MATNTNSAGARQGSKRGTPLEEFAEAVTVKARVTQAKFGLHWTQKPGEKRVRFYCPDPRSGHKANGGPSAQAWMTKEGIRAHCDKCHERLKTDEGITDQEEARDRYTDDLLELLQLPNEDLKRLRAAFGKPYDVLREHHYLDRTFRHVVRRRKVQFHDGRNKQDGTNTPFLWHVAPVVGADPIALVRDPRALGRLAFTYQKSMDDFRERHHPDARNTAAALCWYGIERFIADYRQGDVADTVPLKPNYVVALLEGERDADTFNALMAKTTHGHIIGTCLSHAKPKTLATHQLRLLEDRQMVIIGDADAAGDEAVDRMAALAWGTAQSITCIPGGALQLTGADDDKDFTDWVRKHGGATKALGDQLVELIVRTPSLIQAPRHAREYIRDQDGRILDVSENVRIALDKQGARPRKNLFSGERIVERDDGTAEPLSDDLEVVIRQDIERDVGWYPKKVLLTEVVVDLAAHDTFHPVIDYLDGLRWDGQPRLDAWLTTHAGAEDTSYTRAVGQLILTAAVRRVRQPGCKFDELPILISSTQGTEKSTLLQILAVRDEWFSDSLPIGSDPKVTVERTRGVWIAELSDLAGKTRREVEDVKAALSRRVDGPVRLAYDRHPVSVPRQFVAVGTTNDDKPLKDTTGNRRFWPITVGQIRLDELRRDRDQLWAEAAARAARADWSIRMDPSLWGVARQVQEEHRATHPWEDKIREMLPDGVNGKIRNETLWHLVAEKSLIGLRTQHDKDILGAAMRACGFTYAKTQRLDDGQNPTRASAYVRGNTPYERSGTIILNTSGAPTVRGAVREGENVHKMTP